MSKPITEILHRFSVQRQYNDNWKELKPFYSRTDALDYADIIRNKMGGNAPKVRVMSISTTIFSFLVEDV